MPGKKQGQGSSCPGEQRWVNLLRLFGGSDLPPQRFPYPSQKNTKDRTTTFLRQGASAGAVGSKLAV